MFVEFFFLLKLRGVPVSLTEWMTLMEALDQGLAGSSLSGFYHLSRAVLIKSEAYFDKFDLAFRDFFGGISSTDSLVDSALKWVEHSLPRLQISPEEMQRLREQMGTIDLEELRRQFEERLKEQKEQHHGGSKWIGTGGRSPFGHSGFHPAGIRVGGESGHRSAVKVAAERRFQDYRTDETLGVRQFEVALRRLRALAANPEGPKDEFDLDQTIDQTSRNAGHLKLAFRRPRRNVVKVILLTDVGGSMYPFAGLLNRLFTAVNQSTHFKDLRCYYFHNCVYDEVYAGARLSSANAVKTDYLLRSLPPDYKVILVGDAAMSPTELFLPGGIIDWDQHNEEPGIAWLKRIAGHFHHSIWLNPIQAKFWERTHGTETIKAIREVFPMFELTVDGLEQAVRALVTRK